MNGFVIQPHATGPGGGTSEILVLNTKSAAEHAIEWRYRRGATAWSRFFDQGRIVARLMPGNFTVSFRMKGAGSPHRAPISAAVQLGTNARATLTVNWA
jgi:hypothetical protein